MRCAACGHDNREGAAFCGACGATLSPRCASCGNALGPSARFCDACGQPATPDTPGRPRADLRAQTPPHLAARILRDRAALVGERRTVTVLFIDAVSSVAIGERIDEEELHRIVHGSTERMIEAVHRFEGTVTQFRGDGIMAIFGAPIAHEDSARRAVAAALAMRDTLLHYEADLRNSGSPAFTFRIGLHTGPVIVGRISDDLTMDYTAIGDTVNLASRMEQWARPGAVLITEATQRAIATYFEFKDMGQLEVKGKAETVHAYEVTGELTARTRFDAAIDRGLTPFVGRDGQVAALRGYFEQAKRGEGQVVFVSGDAGIGKSRLLLEFKRSLDDQPVVWAEGHCISYGRNMAYLPIIEILKRGFGVEEGDDEARIIARVDAAMEERGGGELALAAPYLKYLLNVAPGDAQVSVMDPLERRAGILDALRALLRRPHPLGPRVVVVEDLHWIDAKSEEALAVLVDVVATSPVLMILTYHPGYSPSLGDHTYYSRIALRNLPPAESAIIAQGVLQGADLPAGLREIITAKAEGNPFYIEEVGKSLLESGVLRRQGETYTIGRPIDQVRIPDTIQEVILTRIDRLEREAREALQLSAVIGREFTVRLLDRISDVGAKLEGLLFDLKALELIYEKAFFPELSYMFKHALTRDVAYGSLLVERRKSLHRIVATAVEELYADRLPEHYETLAHHYYEGDEPDKAIEYLLKAAEKAAGAYANDEALAFYERALETCERVGESALPFASEAALGRAFVGANIGAWPQAIADFNRTIALAHLQGDQRLEGMAFGYRGMCEFWNHTDFDETVETFRSAIAIGERGFDDVRLFGNIWLALHYIVYGHLAQGGPHAAIAGELIERVKDAPSIAAWGTMGALPANWSGRFDEALAHLGRWWPAVEETHQVLNAVQSKWIEGLARGGRGEYEQAFAALHEALALCERTGEVVIASRCINSVGWLYCELQNHERAIEWNTRGMLAAQAIQSPDPEVESNARLNLADSLTALGRFDEAEAHYAWVEAVYRNPRPQDEFALWLYSQHLLHSFGELWLRRDDPAKALGYAEECIERAEATGRAKNVVKGRRLRAQVLLRHGDLAGADAENARALEIAREIGNPPQLWKTLATLGEVRHAQGRTGEALAAYTDAMTVIESVAEGLGDADVRRTLLASPQVRKIQERTRV